MGLKQWIFALSLGNKLDLLTEAEALDASDNSLFGVDSDGHVNHDQMVTATVTATGGSGGATAGTLVVDLKRANESTDPVRALQVMVRVGAAQYAPGQTPVSTVTFSSATTGTLVASGNGWALIETDATGNFACTISDSADETVYVWCETASKVSDPTDGCVVIGSNSDSATWAA